MENEIIPITKGELERMLERAANSAVRQFKDELAQMMPTIDALGAVLIPRAMATKRAGLGKNTLNQNEKIDKYEEIGKRKTYITLSDISVVKRRKKRGNSTVK